MRRKLFYSLFLLAVTAVSLTICLLLFISYRQVTNENTRSLRNIASVVQNACRNLDYNNLEKLDLKDRLTIMAPDGTVLYDNYIDVGKLDNHLQREEIQQALSSGEGIASRRSDTLSKEVIYYAVSLPQGNVMRLARANDTVFQQFKGIVHYCVIIFLFVTASAFLAARYLTSRVIIPYKRKKQELKTITNNMDEGLVVLDNNREILSINKSAIRFFSGSKEDYVGQSIDALPFAKELEPLLQMLATNEKGALTLDKGSSTYQINGSCTGEQGLVLLIMDVTEKTASEKLRREFSANVSHELKTPLQSILGYSEIMINGMVKEADRPRFLQKIYGEAKNLLQMIDDIIRLSRLDEQPAGAIVSMDLLPVVERAIKRLEPKSERNNITLTLKTTLESVPMQGIPQLLEEIFANLIDNGIKYNKPNGSVSVFLEAKEKNWVVHVRDTGIGIPTEEKERIFERFYRVDKSRNKGVEGTGLGLSIVKHGIMLHKGKIVVNSRLGEGTEVVIKLPRENA